MDTAKEIVKNYAKETGFDLVGISSAESFQADKSVALERIKAGLMDGLPWFTEARVSRGTDPQKLLPGAQSIISVGLSYYQPSDEGNYRTKGKVASYAWGDDYHKIVKKRLRKYVEGLSSRLDRDIRARWYVDDGPMLDRAAAYRAGIGWYGKNTNILSNSHGSWIFLGQVITDLKLEPDRPLKKTCGNCVRCIDSCPTEAIVAPYVIDNRRCISYLTIENRGYIPRRLRPLMYDWVFGCDICQDVCPVNVKAMYSRDQQFRKKRFTSIELVGILKLSEEEFRRRFAGSPIKRAKLAGLKRNACVALGNSGDPSVIPFLVEALRLDEPLVRGHAAWALGRLGDAKLISVLKTALVSEGDHKVRREIDEALEELELSETCS